MLTQGPLYVCWKGGNKTYSTEIIKNFQKIRKISHSGTISFEIIYSQ